MAFNHLPAGVHDALGPLSVTPVTHSVPMAKNHRSDRPPTSTRPPAPPRGTVLDRLAAGPSRAARITHTEHLPPRAGRHAVWPDRIRPEVIDAVQAGRNRTSLGPPGTRPPSTPWTANRSSSPPAPPPASPWPTCSRSSRALLDGSEAPNGRGRDRPVPGPHQGPGRRPAPRREGTCTHRWATPYAPRSTTATPPSRNASGCASTPTTS